MIKNEDAEVVKKFTFNIEAYVQEYFVDINEKENKYEITKFVENFLDSFPPDAYNKLLDTVKSLNKKHKKKN